MRKMIIYEPAMCCSTGLCGVSVNPELLRISTVINNLKKNGLLVDRFNLSNAPQEFVKSSDVNQLLQSEGVEVLPITVVDGIIAVTRQYPSNEEIIELLGVPKSYLGDGAMKVTPKKHGGCGCKGGCC